MESSHTEKLNDLIFADGDVIIRTGSGRNDIFVVHKKILSKYAPWFEKDLSDEWDHKPVTFLDGKMSRDVWEYDMVFDQEQCLGLLASKVSCDFKQIRHTLIFR